MARAASPPLRPRRPAVGRGRGARSNTASRFDALQREDVDDGWTVPDDRITRTDVRPEPVRRIITYNDSPYVGFDRSINPYRGCEHGCVYCFARPSHAWLGLSPGLDFETRILARPGAASALRRELSAKSYQVRPIAIGTNTDPYQPAERQWKVTRDVLSVLAAFGHPVSLLTKSDRVLRDLDVLSPMAGRGLARVMLSITTLDAALALAMEPRAPRPTLRLAALSSLAAAGIPTGVVHGPLIPGLNDHELEALMAASREAGASYAAYTILRLPQEVAGLFTEWLEAAFPERAARVLNQLREINGGQIYDPAWSRAAEPRALGARLIAQRFDVAQKRLGFSSMPGLRTDLFRVPVAPSDQPDLFSCPDP